VPCNVPRVLLECHLRARLSGLELSRAEQQRCRLQLSIDVGRLQFGGAREQWIRVRRIVQRHIGASAFVMRFRPRWLQFDGVPVLNHGFFQTFLCDVAVAACHILMRARGRVACARDRQKDSARNNRRGAPEGITHGKAVSSSTRPHRRLRQRWRATEGPERNRARTVWNARTVDRRANVSPV